MEDIKHVFFDLDHTLWDFEKNSQLTFQKIFTIHNINLPLNIFLDVYKPINFHFWKLYREEKVSKEALRHGRLKQSFEALEYPISDKLINTISIQYIDFLPDFNHLFKGTFEILEYLKNKYELHIITNGFEEVQRKKIISSKIHHYFNQIITSESVGVKKPNPTIFKHALEITNAKIETSIMIGDNLEADIQGALNIGIKAIHCNFDNEKIDSNECKSVNSLLELKQYL